jgi:HSP20 family protein
MTHSKESPMNELRNPDPFDLELIPPGFRQLWRPWRGELEARTPQIRLDVSETEASYTVKAEIPGVKREDIDVRVDGGQVTIAAEVKQDKEEKKDGRVLRSERQYGYASRTLQFASDIESGRVEARYADGVLELRLPKKPTSGAQRITVG